MREEGEREAQHMQSEAQSACGWRSCLDGACECGRV